MTGKRASQKPQIETEKKRKKHVHFIGIAGVAMAPLAVLFKRMGWRVTGSDKAFFPPMSTYLEQNGIRIMPGFKPEHLILEPDLVIVTAFITKKNPEVKYAIARGIACKTYAQVIPQLIEKEHSLVVAGSKGKTSTAALAAWTLEIAGYNPNFLIGGIAKNFPDGIRKTTSSWSVIEGDEYPVASWQETPKFLEYHPRYLILTGATWDHMDIYPTRNAYEEIFKTLAGRISQEGLIIANAAEESVQRILKGVRAPIIWYNTEQPLSFVPPFPGKAWEENAQAVAVLARHIGISDRKIQKAFHTFKGVRRRQEVRWQGKYAVIIDDNAHSPEKVEGVIATLKEQFPGYRILAVYEPGSRNEKALGQKSYGTCFRDADLVLLPRVSAASQEILNFNERLWKKCRNCYPTMEYVPNDKEVIERIRQTAAQWRQSKERGLIVFMSQKGFRGMIEETIREIRNTKS